MELVKSKFETVSRELEVCPCVAVYLLMLHYNGAICEKELCCCLKVWFKDKISRKLPYTDDPVKALGMLNP